MSQGDIDAMRAALVSAVGGNTDAEKKYVNASVDSYGHFLNKYSGDSKDSRYAKDNEITAYFKQHGLDVLTPEYKKYFITEASRCGKKDKERDMLGQQNMGIMFAAVDIEQVYSLAGEMLAQKDFTKLNQMIAYIKQDAASSGMHQALADASSPQHFGHKNKSVGQVGVPDAGQTLTANSEAPEKSADAPGIARAVTIHGVHYLAASGGDPHHGLSGGNIPPIQDDAHYLIAVGYGL